MRKFLLYSSALALAGRLRQPVSKPRLVHLWATPQLHPARAESNAPSEITGTAPILTKSPNLPTKSPSWKKLLKRLSKIALLILIFYPTAKSVIFYIRI